MEPITITAAAIRQSLALRDRFYHLFRTGVVMTGRERSQNTHNNKNEMMQFAGIWSDMAEEDFSDFYEEIEQRRSIVKNFSVESKY
ncbi:MAG: hypothetical protein AAGA80_14975 [Cyanobacteria bacterium P01_F01_bin.143]